MKTPACLSLLLFLASQFTMPVFAAGPDPVVIQVNNEFVTLSQFNRQFEMAMVLAALREGVPNKSGVLIRDLKERFLKARAREIMLKQSAGGGIVVSPDAVDGALDELAHQASGIYGGEQTRLKTEIDSLRERVEEELLLHSIRHALIHNPDSGISDRDRTTNAVERWLEHQAGNFTIMTWPERLD